MGFFSDLKDDLSQAVNELMPEEELDAALAGNKESEGKDTQTPQNGIITSEELSDMLDKVEAMSVESEGLDSMSAEMPDEVPLMEEIPMEALEEVSLTEEIQAQVLDEIPITEEIFAQAVDEMPLTEEIPVQAVDEMPLTEEIPVQAADEIPAMEEIPVQAADEIPAVDELPVEMPDDTPLQEEVPAQEVMTEVPDEVINELREDVQEDMSEEVKEESMEVNEIEQEKKGDEGKMEQPKVASDETAVVTEGMSIVGDITSGGSLELLGAVTGNIEILGKLNVTGSIQGNSKAAEIFAEGARINGEINSQGSVKIGQSSVIIGNIYANSAVIAGAVKGDIDIHGPVVLDTSAIVMGNIKSKSVQINNGAVIEGMCSQCYAEVNPTSFFEEIKKKKDNKDK